MKFFQCGISAVKQCRAVMEQPIKRFKCFDFPRVSPGDQPLAKECEESGYEID